MPLLGAGAQPAGSSYAGADYVPAPVAPAYVVYPDPLSGQSDSGRLIDQATGQFDYTASGDPQGMSAVPQIVQIAWTTLDYSMVGPLDAGVYARAQNAYRNAVASLISGGQLAILSFSARRVGSNGLGVRIRWRDLTTGVEYVYPSGAPQT